jgi:tripartite motif-containing protein 71
MAHRDEVARRLLVFGLVTLAAFAAASFAVAPAPARAAACPGATQQCPYAAAHIVGQRAEGVLRFPEGVAVDTLGNVYVADQLSYVVQKFDAFGHFEGEWGSYGGGPGQFGPIGGLATDATGNVYVVDSSHNRIEKFDPNGNFITQWGSTGIYLGQFRFGSSQDPTKPPGGGIAVSGGYVYVADSGNDRIERFNLEGGEALQWGSPGIEGGEFRFPRGVAANATEVLVADDDNHRIEKFDPNGAYQGAVGSIGAGPGQFDFPYGVALDAAGNAYVADNNNHRIVKLTPELTGTFAGVWGGPGSGPGQFAFPRALASDPAGDTYVADTANDRIQVFDPSGNFLRSWGASGRGAGVLTAPKGLATDPTGRLFVSDTVDNRLELFAPASNAYVGAWTTAGSTPGGRPIGFAGPTGIGVDPHGYVYVADTSNQRLVQFWGDGTYLSELGAGGQLDTPGAVAVGGGGAIYVADTAHNRVLAYASDGSLLAKWGAGEGNGTAGSGQGEFDSPRALAVDRQGQIYVADYGNNRIEKLAPDGSFLTQWGVPRSARNGHFRGPTGVAVDGAGNVYVVDNGNNRVEVFDGDGHYLDKWGQRGTGYGEFSQPTAIAADCDGEVFVADTNNNRIERFDPLSPIPPGCAAFGSWPAPLDVAPVLHVSLTHRSGVLARGGPGVMVSCERGCKLLVTATLSTRTAPQRTIGLIAVAKPLPAARVGHIHLRIANSALKRLRLALGHRHVGLIARVAIVAAGPTGRRTTLYKTYAVHR